MAARGLDQLSLLLGNLQATQDAANAGIKQLTEEIKQLPTHDHLNALNARIDSVAYRLDEHQTELKKQRDIQTKALMRPAKAWGTISGGAASAIALLIEALWRKYGP